MESLIQVLARSFATLWPCYDLRMEIVNFPQQNFDLVGASGVCPHCYAKAYFKPVTSAYGELQGSYQRLCNAAQCEACKKFVLVVGLRNMTIAGRNTPFNLEALYPLGKPNDSVDAAVPKEIADDFREALRCRWIEAHKATVTMCRRAIQASCLEKKAEKKKLVAQIDELAAKGIITEPLKEFAHEVRLEGNDGAHPDADGLENVTPKDADDIIEFTREYLHHVYVMPAKLAARRPAGGPAMAAPAAGKR